MNTSRAMTLLGLAGVLWSIVTVVGCTPQDSHQKAPVASTTPVPSGEKGVSKGAEHQGVATNDATPIAQKETSVETVTHTEEEWKTLLTPEQYRVLREKGTERPFTGKYETNKAKGVYKCAACGAVLFKSDAKFDSGCGWPAFFTPLAKDAVIETVDDSLGMRRTEITCARCGGHLGHVFEDAPDQPTGLRYCINSVSLIFVPDDEAGAGGPSAGRGSKSGK